MARSHRVQVGVSLGPLDAAAPQRRESPDPQTVAAQSPRAMDARGRRYRSASDPRRRGACGSCAGWRAPDAPHRRARARTHPLPARLQFASTPRGTSRRHRLEPTSHRFGGGNTPRHRVRCWMNLSKPLIGNLRSHQHPLDFSRELLSGTPTMLRHPFRATGRCATPVHDGAATDGSIAEAATPTSRRPSTTHSLESVSSHPANRYANSSRASQRAVEPTPVMSGGALRSLGGTRVCEG